MSAHGTLRRAVLVAAAEARVVDKDVPDSCTDLPPHYRIRKDRMYAFAVTTVATRCDLHTLCCIDAHCRILSAAALLRQKGRWQCCSSWIHV